MVARDGIEPPTPAFSGPRSTTELPGLSADLIVAVSCAGSRRNRARGGLVLEQCDATLSVYQFHFPRANSAARPGRRSGLVASKFKPSPYTGWQLCVRSSLPSPVSLCLPL